MLYQTESQYKCLGVFNTRSNGGCSRFEPYIAVLGSSNGITLTGRKLVTKPMSAFFVGFVSMVHFHLKLRVINEVKENLPF